MLLIVVAIVLGRETWSLLLGRGRDLVDRAQHRDLARNEPGIVEANLPRTVVRRISVRFL